MRVLIADDNQINREFLKGVLESEHCRIIEASDGRAAVDCCRQTAFDVILMDIRMPGMDGVQAAREIRCIPGFQVGATAIIALTADLQLQQQTDLMTQGFDAVLLKPVSRVTLLEALQKPTEPSSMAEDAAPTDAPIDEEAALATAGGSRQLVARLRAMLVHELGEFLPRIGSAIKAGDMANVREMAHKIRGSAGYTGARKLQQAASGMELAAMRRQAAEISAALQNLEECARELGEYCQGQTGD